MITKKRKGFSIPKKRRKSPCPKISVRFLAVMFKMENDKPFLGVVEVMDDSHIKIPALIDFECDQYVNLTTGELTHFVPDTFAYRANVWYMPRNDTFRFIVRDKCLASVFKTDLIKVFGNDVIA